MSQSHVNANVAHISYAAGYDRNMLLMYVKEILGAGPMAEWLNSCAPLRRPTVRTWARTWHRSLGRGEVVSHMPQLEGPTTKIYNYALGGFWEEKKKQQEEKRKEKKIGNSC